MDIALVLVPSHAGDDRAPSSRGPEELVARGAADVLAAHGADVTVQTVERTGPFRDTASSSAEVDRRVAAVVCMATADGRLPIVLAGSCTAALGVLAGLEHDRRGVVWIDAHADFNTPESSTSGFFPGMSLAIATGHCYRDYRSAIGDSPPVAESAVVLFGVRDLSPEAERERLRASEILTVEWRDGRPQGSVEEALDTLRGRVADVYLHLDFDAFAPEVAPGVADEPVPGGLTQADADAIVRGTAARFALRAVTFATYAPARDVEERTLRLALELLGLVGSLAATKAGEASRAR